MAFGGFANELVDSQPPELQWECSICLQVVRDPHMVSCCSLRYCRTCIERVQRQGRTCPHCLAEKYTITRDFQLERILLFKRGFCINKDRGCKWVGELRNAEKHVQEDCMWTEVDCPNQCGQEVLRCKLEQHVRKDCPQRGKPCEFAAMGCESGLLTPTTLQSHLDEGIHTHLTLLGQKLKKMEENVLVTQQQELMDLKTKVQTCEAERRDMETKVQAYEREKNELKRRVQAYEREKNELKSKVQTHEREKNELRRRVQACEGEVKKVVQEAKEKQSKNKTYKLLGIIFLIAAALWLYASCCPATCTSDMKTHCSTKEGYKIGSWQNEPAINASTPENVDPGKGDPGKVTTAGAPSKGDPSTSTPDEADPDPPLWVSFLVLICCCWCCLYGLGIVK